MADEGVIDKNNEEENESENNNNSNVNEGDEVQNETIETAQENLEPNLTPMSPKLDPTKRKIDIYLKPTGSAPIMKKRKWAVEADKKIYWVMNFVRRYLKLDIDAPLFIYVNQAFAPSPDQSIGNLYDCFESDGKLVLHYCSTQAWG